jgi:tripartite-type tricarboxylate transporter receptor subunit TctC
VNRRKFLTHSAAATSAFYGSAVMATEPSAPLRLLLGFTPGATVDIVARILADSLRASFGRSVFVEHKAGAGQRLALNELRRTPPDGRTLFVGTLSPFTIYPNISRELDFDPVNDFTPVARLVTFDACVATGPATGAADMQQLVAWLKSHPERASYGSPGNGTQPHFEGFAVGQGIGVPLVHIPYKGGSLALNDLMGGQIPMMISSLPHMMEMHRAGRIRIVAVTGGKRSLLLPEVPTLQELKIPLKADNSVAAYGPPMMSAAVVKSLNDELVAAVNSPGMKSKLAQAGLMASPSSSKELAQIQAHEKQYLGRIIKASGYVQSD